MKCQAMQRSAYEQMYGVLSTRGLSAERLELLEKFKKQSITEVLVFDVEKGDSLDKLKARLYAVWLSLSKKFKPNFKLIFYKNAEEGQVVVVKVARS